MGLLNTWTACGVVNEEPKLMKLSDDKLMAKSIIVVTEKNVKTYIPIIAFNKKARILCALAHRGSLVYAKGVVSSHLEITSKRAKTLVGIVFKVTDFAVLKREPIKIEDIDFVDVVQLYDPERFMEERKAEDVKQ